jgi:hypothetical protein
MYAKTVAGLVTCYAAGLPFFRHTLEGDLLYTSVMFGLPVVAVATARWMRRPQGTASAA